MCSLSQSMYSLGLNWNWPELTRSPSVIPNNLADTLQCSELAEGEKLSGECTWMQNCLQLMLEWGKLTSLKEKSFCAKDWKPSSHKISKIQGQGTKATFVVVVVCVYYDVWSANTTRDWSVKMCYRPLLKRLMLNLKVFSCSHTIVFAANRIHSWWLKLCWNIFIYWFCRFTYLNHSVQFKFIESDIYKRSGHKQIKGNFVLNQWILNFY